METLGERIRRLRLEKNISQRNLAKMVGTSPGLISFIERDRNKPNYRIIGRLAKVLGISTDYLIFGEEARSESMSDLIDRLKEDVTTSSQEMDITFTKKEKELISRYNILSRLAKLSRTDLEVVTEVLRRLEQC